MKIKRVAGWTQLKDISSETQTGCVAFVGNTFMRIYLRWLRKYCYIEQEKKHKDTGRDNLIFCIHNHYEGLSICFACLLGLHNDTNLD